jgi:hypothetical protein
LKGPVDVCLDEGVGIDDTSVYMGFCGEVDYGFNRKLKDLLEVRSLRYVAFGERISFIFFDVLEVLGIARVGKLVEVNYMIGVLCQYMTDKVGPDKTTTAGN